jgi:hypothetical protein
MIELEMFLAVSLLFSVVLVGYLISLGNERQRRELRGLREQIEGWAIENLRNQGTRLRQEVCIADPLGWLNRVATSAVGVDLHLWGMRQLANPQGIQAWTGEGEQLVFSPHAPAVVRSAGGRRAGRRLAAGGHPLLPYPRRVKVFELSALTTGTRFDLELAAVWKALTGHEGTASRLYLYVIPPVPIPAWKVGALAGAARWVRSRFAGGGACEHHPEI